MDTLVPMRWERPERCPIVNGYLIRVLRADSSSPPEDAGGDGNQRGDANADPRPAEEAND